MRPTPVLLAVFMLSSAAALAHQDTNSEKPRSAKRGDNVVVKGCLRGGILESSEMEVADKGDPLPAAHTFHLKGKKDLLKKLRELHDGYLVSDLPERPAPDEAADDVALRSGEPEGFGGARQLVGRRWLCGGAVDVGGRDRRRGVRRAGVLRRRPAADYE